MSGDVPDYPSQRVGPRSSPRTLEQSVRAQMETAAGSAEPPVQLSQAFLDRQVVAAGPDLEVYRPRRWLKALIVKKATPQEVLDKLTMRFMKGLADLHEARAVLNEIGRMPDGGKLLRRHITKELLDRLKSRRR